MSSAIVWNDGATLRRLVVLVRLRRVLRVLRASESLQPERIVDRRRTSLAVRGSTTPSALRLRRENFGGAAVESQLSSGLRDVLGWFVVFVSGGTSGTAS